MDIFGIGIPELLVILVLTMVAVGPEKMVEYSGKAGKWFAKFRRETSAVTKEFKDAIDGAVEDAELEDDTKKNQTPTQWRFTPTQFAVSGTAAQSKPEAAPSPPRATVSKDTSEQDALDLIESLSDEDALVSSASVQDTVQGADAEPVEPVDEVLAAAAAEQRVIASRTSSRVSRVASAPRPSSSEPRSVAADGGSDEDFSDLLGSAFGVEDEEPAKTPTPIVTQEKAPEPKVVIPEEVETVKESKPASADDSDDLDLLGEALSFSFGDQEDEGGR